MQKITPIKKVSSVLSTPIKGDDSLVEKKETNNGQWKEIKTKGLDFIIVSCLFLVFFLCPLFFTGLASQGVGFEKMVLFYFLVLIGVVAWVIKGVVAGGLQLKRTPLDFPIIAVLVFFIASTVFSVNQHISIIGSYGSATKGLAATIVFILFYYLLVNNLSPRRLKVLFWAFISSASIVIIYSLLQLFSIFVVPFAFAKNITFNPIGSLSSLTMFLIISLPLLIVAATQLKEISPKLKGFFSGFVKAIIVLVALVNITILTFLNGITFWVAAIAGVAVVLLFFLSRIIKVTNNNLVIPVTAFFLLVIFLVLGNFNIVNLSLPTEVSLSRSATFDIAWGSVKEKPIVGSGPSTFYYSFSKFKPSDFNSSPLWNVRFVDGAGFLFEQIATVGILGALAVLALIIMALVYSFKALIAPKAKEHQPILLAFFASFISIIILSSLFSFNNSLILVSILVGVLTMAAAIATKGEKEKEINLSFEFSPKYNLAVSALFLAVSAGVIVMFALGVKIYLADVYAAQSISAQTQDEKIAKLNKAIIFAPYHDVYHTSLANLYMNEVNRIAQTGSGADDQNKMLTNLNLAIKEAREAIRIAPGKAANHEFLALVYENASYYTQGGITVWAKSLEDAYNKVIELEPNNPTPYFRIALVNVARANLATDNNEKANLLNEAIKYYGEATARKNNLSEAYYGRGIAYETLANFDEAIKNLENAVVSSGQNIDYTFELGRLYFNRGMMGATKGETEYEETVIDPETGEETIVTKTKPTVKGERNSDLNTAEQIFSSILQAVPEHANAMYSLAMIYQAVGEIDKMDAVVEKLLNTIQDETQKAKIREQF